MEDAPVSTRKRSESEPLTNAVTYIRLSPAIAKGISPTGVSFIILPFALNDIKTKANIAIMNFACDFIIQN